MDAILSETSLYNDVTVIRLGNVIFCLGQLLIVIQRPFPFEMTHAEALEHNTVFQRMPWKIMAFSSSLLFQCRMGLKPAFPKII